MQSIFVFANGAIAVTAPEVRGGEISIAV